MSELAALSYVADTGMEKRTTSCLQVCTCMVRTCMYIRVGWCVYKAFQNYGSIKQRIHNGKQKSKLTFIMRDKSILANAD